MIVYYCVSSKDIFAPFFSLEKMTSFNLLLMEKHEYNNQGEQALMRNNIEVEACIYIYIAAPII